MNTQHLSEAAIQQYVLDKENSPEDIREHMQLCALCQAAAETYQVLFTGIQEQPVAAFDFDLSALVLPQLPQAKRGWSWGNFFIYATIFLFVAAGGFSLYWLKDYLLPFIKGISSVFTYLLVTTIITILVFQCIDMYRKYQKKIQSLDLY